MPAPTITEAPPPPLRSQSPSTFTTLAENFVDWMADLPDEINAFGDYLETFTPEGGASAGPVGSSNLTMATSRILGRVSASTGAIEELTAAQVKTLLAIAVADITGLGAGAAMALPLTFNFADDGTVKFYADEAMTLTQQATNGTGSVAYEKSTSAAPGTFSTASSPISLQAGAWLKVTASGTAGDAADPFAVHLKRTA